MERVKKIDIVPYNPEWPGLFEKEAKIICKALGANLVAVHHVGSTAVPGLAAKPKIDIIAVVKMGNSSIKVLESSGFVYTGEWNIPFKYGFSKRGVVDVNVHVFEEGHSAIEWNLMFRDYLRSHPEVRDSYAALKQRLVQDMRCGEKAAYSLFSNYNTGKNSFIHDVLRTAGFNKIRFMRCTHEIEWDAYNRIIKEQVGNCVGVSADFRSAPIMDENHAYFVLYQGVMVVAAAHVEFLNNQEARVHFLAADENYKGLGFEQKCMVLIEQWIGLQGKTIIR